MTARSRHSIEFVEPVMRSSEADIVLIVDDTPNNLKVLSDTLADAGFEVAIAISGERALQQLDHTPVSLILLDVMMPGMDGFETCQRLKAKAATANIPVIFMTALSESVNKVKGFEVGAVDYITKPFHQAEVLMRVQTHLKLSQLSQTLEARNTELQQLTGQLEQRVAERTQALVSSVETLQQTQQLLRLVFDTVPQWVAWKDLDSVYLGCNESFAKAMGLRSAAEIVGKTDAEMPCSRAEADWYRSCDERVIRSGQAELHIIERSRRADGAQIWLDTNKIPLRDANSHVFGILLVTEDITDRQQAAEQLQQQKHDLEQALAALQNTQVQLVQSEKMSALGNLVAGVAHEINNPVGFISGNIEPAKEYVQDLFDLLNLYQEQYVQPVPEIEAAIDTIDLDYLRQDLPKLLDSMKVGVDRIRDISTSLRTFSRADRDYKVPFNIHDGIDSTILILKHRLKGGEHTPVIEVVRSYGNVPPIECFPGQLNQVFMNLLANAIDALEEQSRLAIEALGEPNQDTAPAIASCIEIETQLDDAGNQVMIHIRDNGMGMPENVKHQAFNHLFTTKAVGKGTGLGLAIAHQIIVEKHNGRIDLHSQPGEGTVFTITLPVQAVSEVLNSEALNSEALTR